MSEEVSRTLEVPWDFSGGDDDPDFVYLCTSATFEHREACEFILHVGDAGDTYAEDRLREMRAAGCSDELLAEYRRARELGCRRVLFWS